MMSIFQREREREWSQRAARRYDCRRVGRSVDQSVGWSTWSYFLFARVVAVALIITPSQLLATLKQRVACSRVLLPAFSLVCMYNRLDMPRPGVVLVHRSPLACFLFSLPLGRWQRLKFRPELISKLAQVQIPTCVWIERERVKLVSDSDGVTF